MAVLNVTKIDANSHSLWIKRHDTLRKSWYQSQNDTRVRPEQLRLT